MAVTPELPNEASIIIFGPQLNVSIYHQQLQGFLVYALPMFIIVIRYCSRPTTVESTSITGLPRMCLRLSQQIPKMCSELARKPIVLLQLMSPST